MASLLQPIAEGIAGLIRTAAPKANVMSQWRLPFLMGDWPGFLKSTLDGDIVHAWVIGTNTLRQTPKMMQRANAHKNFDPTFRIWGFLQWRFNSDTDNSSLDFNAELDEVCDILSINAQLGISDSNIAAFVKGHNELQVLHPIDVFNLGGTETHIIRATLEVLAYKQVS